MQIDIIDNALKLCVEHERATQLTKAEQGYRQILEVDSNHPEALYRLGVLMRQKGEYQTAENLLKNLLQVQPNSIKALFSLGNLHHEQNQLDEAIADYNQILALQPDAVSAYNNLGHALKQQGKWKEAMTAYQKALELQPNCVETNVNLGNALHAQGKLYPDKKPHYAQLNNRLGSARKQAGDWKTAAAYYRQAIILQPDLAEAHNNLGIVLQMQGNLDAAHESCLQAIRIKPDYAFAHNNLGNILWQQGNLDAAIESFQKALEIQPDLATVYNNLGDILNTQGKLEAAMDSYQQALKIQPNFAIAHNNLGNILVELGKFGAAQKSYQKALEIKPNFAEAHNNLGAILRKQGNLDAAIESFQKALEIKPDLAEAHNNLGNLLKRQGKIKAALESYQQALKIQPDFIDAYFNLGIALSNQGKLEAAIKTFQQALKIQPDLAMAKFLICIDQLPIIPASFAEIELRRNNYQRHLEDLAQHYRQANLQELKKAANAVGSSQPFYLAYQGLNDRDLQQIYGEMLVHIMSNSYPQWSKDISLPNLKANEKVRIGFVSGFFYEHSVWKIPIKGWVENLDRSEFELFGYYTNQEHIAPLQGKVTARAAKSFDKFIKGPLPLEKWAEIIQQDKLHILIFPEFGMDAATLQLGCLKLAPIQVVFGGHPETSGLPTIDYHLSSNLMEPENAQDHYTEKLIRLPNLAIHYTLLPIEAKPTSKRDIGIAEDEIMFWSCQSLYKYLPQHDDVFPRIARKLDKSKFVFIQNTSKDVTEVFQQRLSRAFKEFGLNYKDYCIFLPRLNSSAFAGVTAIADVFLDNVGWSGNNTTMESTAFNIPIVTYPQEMMRGRHAMAILKMMGIDETIAATKEDYVKIAVRLGGDAEYRQHISQLIAQNKHKLYGDLKPIRALEEFLLNAVGKPRKSAMPNVAEILRLAIQEHRQNRLEQAEQAYCQVLSIQPNQPEALYGLGMLAQQTEKFTEAEKFLSAATQVQPDSVKIWFTLGNLRLVQEQLPEAEAAYKRAIALRSDAVSIYNNLGYALQQQGKWEEAMNCYQKALDVQPNCVEADVNLGNALQSQGILSPDKQLHYAQLNHKLGLARKKAGDLQTAEIYFQKALELNPNYADDVYNSLGEIHKSQ